MHFRNWIIFYSLFFGTVDSYSQSIFFENYPESKKTVIDTYERLSLLKELPNEKGKLIYCLVAPEVAMYKNFLDLMETGAAEIFYTNFGGEYGNFSLGIFQMKPTFAEEVEKIYPKKCKAGKYLKRLKYADTAQAEIRSERIQRLKSEEWQQVYLICCYEILEARYGAKFPDLRKRISFYAAAYNYGFNSTSTGIGNWEKKISFPGRGEKSIISYSELAVAFLELMVENIPQVVESTETKALNPLTDTIALDANEVQKVIVDDLDKPKKDEAVEEKKTTSDDKFNSSWLLLFFLIIPVFIYWKWRSKKIPCN